MAIDAGEIKQYYYAEKPMYNSPIAEKFLDPKMTVLIAAGFLHSDLRLSETGLQALAAVFMEDNMDKLVAIA